MYLHIGDNKTISDSFIIGVFNIVSLKKSEENSYLFDNIKLNKNKRSIIVLENNEKFFSKINSATLLNRELNENDIVWRKNNV